MVLMHIGLTRSMLVDVKTDMVDVDGVTEYDGCRRLEDVNQALM
jgi:hypothetical protein